MRKFKLGIRNLIRWFKVIWRDRDYDTSFIWEILKTKLKNQAEYIGKHDRTMSSKKNSQMMMTCVRLIEKIENETYDHEWYKFQHSEYLWIPDTPGSFRLEINEIWEKYDEYFAKYPHAYREVTKNEKYIFANISKQNIAMNMSHYMDKKANRLLFKILERDLRKWWD